MISLVDQLSVDAVKTNLLVFQVKIKLPCKKKCKRINEKNQKVPLDLVWLAAFFYGQILSHFFVVVPLTVFERGRGCGQARRADVLIRRVKKRSRVKGRLLCTYVHFYVCIVVYTLKIAFYDIISWVQLLLVNVVFASAALMEPLDVRTIDKGLVFHPSSPRKPLLLRLPLSTRRRCVCR